MLLVLLERLALHSVMQGQNGIINTPLLRPARYAPMTRMQGNLYGMFSDSESIDRKPCLNTMIIVKLAI